MWIEGIFGPIYIGAMIHALSELKQGYRPSYSRSMRVGLQNWGRLFVARLIAGLVVVLGLIAFIIPGIVLMVRYALLDPAVVLEGAGPVDAIKRSTVLTAGVRWQIFFAGLSFFVAWVLFTILIYLPLGIWPQYDTLAANVALDCVLDITFGIIQIVMFLYYWQSAEQERAAGEPTEPRPADIIDNTQVA
jgi:uncharacterized membrane protein